MDGEDAWGQKNEVKYGSMERRMEEVGRIWQGCYSTFMILVESALPAFRFYLYTLPECFYP